MLDTVTMLEESGVTADRYAKELPSWRPMNDSGLKDFFGYFRAFESERRRARVLDLPRYSGIFTMRLRKRSLKRHFAQLTRASVKSVSTDLTIQRIRKSVLWNDSGLFQELRFRLAEGVGTPNPVLAQRHREGMAGDETLDLSMKVTLVEARTRWQEVTAICRLIKRITAERPGRDLSGICVALPKPEVYTDIIRERFATYGIPSNLTDRFELSRSPLVIDILGSSGHARA